MITVYFNNEALQLEQVDSLLNFIEQRTELDTGFAVALNRSFVPRSNYATTFLKNNDVIEIIRPMQGG